MRRTLTIRILHTNSQLNKQLIMFLHSVLPKTTRRNIFISIEFGKEDNNTKYPMLLSGQDVRLFGLNAIKNYVENIVDQQDESEDTRAYQMSIIRKGGDEEEKEDADTLSMDEIRRRSEDMMKVKNIQITDVSSVPVNKDDIGYNVPVSLESKKVDLLPPSTTIVPPKVGGAKHSVREKSKDKTIRGAFADMKDRSEDDILLQNMFANMEESSSSY